MRKRFIPLAIASLAFVALTAASKPAFAFKPIKITLTCSASGGDVVTGSFSYLTLCESSSSCSGTTAFDCTTLPDCDSSSTVSQTVVCTPPFNAAGFMAAAEATDYLLNTSTPLTAGFGGGSIIYPLAGKGFTYTIYPNPPSTSDNVVLTVK